MVRSRQSLSLALALLHSHAQAPQVKDLQSGLTRSTQADDCPAHNATAQAVLAQLDDQK